MCYTLIVARQACKVGHLIPDHGELFGRHCRAYAEQCVTTKDWPTTCGQRSEPQYVFIASPDAHYFNDRLDCTVCKEIKEDPMLTMLERQRNGYIGVQVSTTNTRNANQHELAHMNTLSYDSSSPEDIEQDKHREELEQGIRSLDREIDNLKVAIQEAENAYLEGKRDIENNRRVELLSNAFQRAKQPSGRMVAVMWHIPVTGEEVDQTPNNYPEHFLANEMPVLIPSRAPSPGGTS